MHISIIKDVFTFVSRDVEDFRSNVQISFLQTSHDFTIRIIPGISSGKGL